MKPTPYPILDALKVPHRVAYDLLVSGVEFERIKYRYYEALGDAAKSNHSLANVLYGEKLLSFMRINRLAALLNKRP